jgi:hypothetical protein
MRDYETLESTWDDIMSIESAKKESALTWKYTKPIKDKNEIATFEKKYRIIFPVDYKKFIKDNNGGHPSRTTFDTRESKGRVIKTLLSFNPKDSESIQKFITIDDFKRQKNGDQLVPFASTPGGDFICFNFFTMPGQFSPLSKYVPILTASVVVLYLHESGKYENITQMFSWFLSKLY